MRIQVVYDKNGAIIGGSTAQPPASDVRSPRAGPEAGEGQHAAEFEVPAEHAGLTLRDLAERLRVDVKGKEHRLVPKGA